MKRYYTHLGPIILIITWFIVAKLQLIDPFLLPGPFKTFNKLLNLISSGVILDDLVATTERVFWSLLIAMAVGWPTGLALGSSKKIYESVEFIIDFFRSVPSTALFPLFILIFGVTDASKIAVAAFAAVLIIVFNTAYGVINASNTRSEMAKLMGASKFQVFTDIIFWESLPQTFIGLRNATSLGLVIIIVAEMFIGTSAGLGRAIIDAQTTYNIATMYSAIILSGMLGFFLNWILVKAEKNIVHWKN